MTQKVNSVFRIYRTIDLMSKVNLDKTEAIDVWASVFEVEHSENYEFKVIQKLNLFSQELDRAKNLVESKVTTTPKYFLDALEAAKNTIKLRHLNDRIPKTLVAEQKLSYLHICSNLLDHEENLIPEDEIKQILNDIQKLRESIDADYKSGSLKYFVLQHLEIIQDTIQDYHIIGLRAFKNAAYKSSIINHEGQDLIKEEKKGESQAFKTLKKIYQKFGQYVEKYNNSTPIKLLNTGYQLENITSDIISLF